jgi:alpha-L-fucosidase
MKPMELDGFNPTELDCDNWISAIKQAGAKYAILVTKHHDGFANWPSRYTGYSVAGTPWKDGKGDVVAEFVAACRKNDIKTGLYYSPAEFGLKENKRTSREYDDYFINQISELLTNYGKIDYLWFDGCGSEGHKYDTVRIIGEIRRMQPEILIFNMWDPDTRWVGNEAGIAPMPCFNTVSSINFSVLTDKKTDIEGKKWLPAECDCRIRLENWFYSDKDEDTVKSLEELVGLYYYSVGRGANLLINIGPDRRGLLPEKDADSLISFGKEIKRRFSKPIAVKKDFNRKENRYVCHFQEPVLVNHLIACEDLLEAEHIFNFNILIKPFPYGEEISVYKGESVGHKAICQFPTIRTTEVIFEITGGAEGAALEDIQLFFVQN